MCQNDLESDCHIQVACRLREFAYAWRDADSLTYLVNGSRTREIQNLSGLGSRLHYLEGSRDLSVSSDMSKTVFLPTHG